MFAESVSDSYSVFGQAFQDVMLQLQESKKQISYEFFETERGPEQYR